MVDDVEDVMVKKVITELPAGTVYSLCQGSMFDEQDPYF
jgi:hypothetical protein